MLVTPMFVWRLREACLMRAVRMMMVWECWRDGGLLIYSPAQPTEKYNSSSKKIQKVVFVWPHSQPMRPDSYANTLLNPLQQQQLFVGPQQ